MGRGEKFGRKWRRRKSDPVDIIRKKTKLEAGDNTMGVSKMKAAGHFTFAFFMIPYYIETYADM
jgi:hypothetical protein